MKIKSIIIYHVILTQNNHRSWSIDLSVIIVNTIVYRNSEFTLVFRYECSQISELFYYAAIKTEQPKKSLVYLYKPSQTWSWQPTCRVYNSRWQYTMSCACCGCWVAIWWRILTEFSHRGVSRLRKNKNMVVQNHILLHDCHQDKNYIRKEFSCLNLLQLTSVIIPANKVDEMQNVLFHL